MKTKHINISNIIHELEQDITENVCNTNDNSLFNGRAGVLILYYLLYENTQDSQYIDKIGDVITQIFQDINEDNYSGGNSFCNGLAGIGYALNLLKKKKIISEEFEVVLKDFDTILLQEIDACLHNKKFDFLHGGLGIALCLLERASENVLLQEKIDSFFSKYIFIVEEQIKKDNSLEFFDESGDYTAKYNLGMAHGLISNLCLLIKYSNQISHDVRSIIKAISNKILEFYKKENSCQFPSIIYTNRESTYNAPLGWCYGDNIIALGLLKSAVFLEDSYLYSIAEQVAINALKRDHERFVVKDAMICHGTAGVSYIYEKLYKITSNEKLKESSQKWFETTLDFYSVDEKSHSYRTYVGDDEYTSTISLLNGKIGIAIMLLMRENSNLDSDWDNILLLN
ncbi:lanthionine synthetase C family protein [Chryseobacterium sp. PTM-20240506]|uniref:lanthionine synthetase C family protein n=1 Tax=unclassified Chryseobacterium TaxID=2593645 RepID=UPI00235824A6|nr:lanthionine synthetase C family protein [Chryseobacterium sp. B21-037]MDC8106603.1 lanthionine synthetase C family protein [Chryseobacterium sp. B21-037]